MYSRVKKGTISIAQLAISSQRQWLVFSLDPKKMLKNTLVETIKTNFILLNKSAI
jgi:anion-transporting  ArsA/GET3 family ATPase